MLLAAVLDGVAEDAVSDDLLARAQALARANEVEGALARVYRHRLGPQLDAINQATEQFRVNVQESARLLGARKVTPVLIKAHADDYTYSNFDLVVRPSAWPLAIDSLAGWTVRASSYWLEPDKILLHPVAGPAVHLHKSVSWFGVPIIPAETLYERATASAFGQGILVPEQADAVRILIAHAAFQTLEFRLADLLELKTLLESGVTATARRRSAAEGWGSLYDEALSAGVNALGVLERRAELPLPVPLGLVGVIPPAFAHARHVWRLGRRRRAVRTAGMRLALTAAKAARRR